MASQAPLSIVRLDAIHCPPPLFPSTLPHTYTSYDLTNPTQVASRLQTANIAITTTVPITNETLSACPSLKLIAVMAIGTDIVDLAACKEHGVQVCNVPAASNESVAEHAIALYFALRRRLVRLHELTVQGEQWKGTGSLKGVFGSELPGTCKEEILGVIGVGELGNRVANIGRALGMRVLLSDRKISTAPRPDRTPFDEVLRVSTVIILTCPRTPETLNLISAPELSLMHPEAVIINVARGGILDEAAAVQALREKKIAGVAADVFLQEPATKENSALVNAGEEPGMEGKMVLTPHVAWCARSSIEKLRRVVRENISSWANGELTNGVR